MNKITITMACKLAKISRPTLYKHIKNGLLSVVKDGNRTHIEPSELMRVFPDIKLNDSKGDINNLHDLTTELIHKDDLIKILKQQLTDRQKDNEFLQNQLTQLNENFSTINKLLEDKIPKKRKKLLGIF